MKRIILLSLMAVTLLLTLTNCFVNESSYSIVFQNDSDKAATLKVGGNQMWVTAGGDWYFVYYTSQKKASVELTGVSIEGLYFFDPAFIMNPNGPLREVESVDLELGYQYNFTLVLEDSEYTLHVKPVKVGEGKDIDEIDLITFK